MKHLLLTTIAAVVLVGCGPSASDISIHTAAGGHIKAVKQHLAAGTDVNAKNNAEMTPLHYAARLSQKEIAELLIAAGANVNAKADYGETPVDEAINLENTKTANLLRKHGGKTGEELKADGK